MARCTHCGKVNRDDSLFCQECGQRLEAPKPVPAPTPSSARATEASDPNVVFVTSPFVGTFYRAPSPESEDFVAVNGSVKKGQTLCIIEAMKLMNEIEAEFSGTILEVLVDSGKSVEFGQKLFKIKKS